jgi:hypothetical protein
MTLISIILFTFLKSIADTIKVPGIFDNSWFSKFKGMKWIDPLVTVPEPKNWVIRPFVAMFRDLWHTCNTLIILNWMWFAYLYKYEDLYWSWVILVVIWWLIYGYCFELFLRLWKILFNP